MRQTKLTSADGACISVFDPVVVKNYTDEDLNQFDFKNIEGVKSGNFFNFFTMSDGGFKVEVTDEDLTDLNKTYATQQIKRVGLKVVSGKIYITGGMFEKEEKYLSEPIELDNGEYDVTVTQVCWYFSSDEEKLKNDPSVSDFVVQIKTRTEPFILSGCELKLDTVYVPSIPMRNLCQNPFLFPDLPKNLKEDYQLHKFTEEELT